VKRRAGVVGIFPDLDAVLRSVGSAPTEIHDEWQAGRRYFSLDSMAKLKEPQSLLLVRTEPLRQAPIR